MLGATTAGMAFSNASVALVHGMSRPIGAFFHVPHGLSNAMLLPEITAFSAPAALERYADCARAMGIAEEGEGSQAAVARLLDELRRLNDDLKVPSPKGYGIDRVRYDDVIPIARVIMDSFVNGSVDRALLVYPRFISTLSQRPEVVQLLPIEPPESAREARAQRLDYIFEPDPQSILEQLLPRYIEVQIYQAILETAASFFSAQMVAMRNATDNANDLVQDLSLTYNKVRQANITREVTEIASAAEAMAASSKR